MKLYLDDDSADGLLIRLLRKAGHDVVTPAEATLSGSHDAVHFRHSIHTERVLLSGNHDDFKFLHELIIEAKGHHPGVLIVRDDNNPKRDLKASGIVRAIGKMIAVNAPTADLLQILNHWR